MEGTVEGISSTTKAVKIDGNWINAAEIWEFANQLNKGDEIEYNLTKDGKSLTFVRVKTEKPKKVEKSESEKVEESKPEKVEEPKPKRKETKELPEKDLSAFMPEDFVRSSKDEQIAKMNAINNAMEYAKLHPNKDPPWTPNDIKLIARDFYQWIIEK